MLDEQLGFPSGNVPGFLERLASPDYDLGFIIQYASTRHASYLSHETPSSSDKSHINGHFLGGLVAALIAPG